MVIIVVLFIIFLYALLVLMYTNRMLVAIWMTHSSYELVVCILAIAST